MAYWIAGSAANYNDTANWSATSGGSGGEAVPSDAADAIFDGNGLGDCRFNVALTNAVNITVNSGYTGTLDGATDDLSHDIGDFDGSTASSASITLGDGTWTINGNFDVAPMSVTRNSSTVVMAGTSKTMSMEDLNNVTISGTITGTPAGTMQVRGTFSVTGSFTIPASGNLNARGATFTVGASGTITGDGKMVVFGGTSITYTAGATLSCNHIEYRNGALTIPAFDQSAVGTVELSARAATETITLGAGTHTFNHLKLVATTGRVLQIPNNTNNPNLTIKGDVILDIDSAAGLVWTAGTGTITADGTGDQDWGWGWGDGTLTTQPTVEDIEIDKSAGDLIMTFHWKTQSFLGTQADNFYTGGFDLETTGDLEFTQNCPVHKSTLGGTTFTSGGAFTLTGTMGVGMDLRAATTWYIDATGTATADEVLVSNSDASAGSTVTATNSYDYGGNVNWSGLVVVYEATHSATLSLTNAASATLEFSATHTPTLALTNAASATFTEVYAATHAATLALTNAAVAAAPRVYNRTVRNTMAFVQTLARSKVYVRDVISDVEVLQDFSPVDNGTPIPVLTNMLLLQEAESSVAKARTVITDLEFFQFVSTGSNLETVLDFIQTVTRSIAYVRDVSNTLTFVQSAGFNSPIVRNVSHDLTFVQAATYEDYTFAVSPYSELAFVQTASFAGSSFNFSAVSDLTFTQETSWTKNNHVSSVKLDSNLCTVAPSANATTITLEYDGTSLELRAPLLSNREEVLHTRVQRKTLNGVLKTFIDSRWVPKIVYRYKLEGLTDAKRAALVSFLSDSLGQVVTLTDYEGNAHSIIILTPKAEFQEFARLCASTSELDFYVL